MKQIKYLNIKIFNVFQNGVLFYLSGWSIYNLITESFPLRKNSKPEPFKEDTKLKINKGTLEDPFFLNNVVKRT